MTGLILYIIKSTLYLSVFHTFFMLVMRRTTFFRFNRVAFMAGTFICMALPFIDIAIPETVAVEMPMVLIENALNHEAETVPLEGAVISAGSDKTGRSTSLVEVLYITGVLVSLLITVRSYIMMRKMMMSAKSTYIDGVPVRITDYEIPSFSWGRHIVISRKDLEENPAILTHEKMHVRCGHSIDLMTYAFVTVMHWFNPLVWIARTELKMLHEYEADELTINNGIDATQYQLLLVMKAVGAKRFQLANGFNHSKLKNRITMMHKNKTNKWVRLAYILCIPALIGAMCCCSNRSKSTAEEEEQPIPFELVFSNCTAQISSSDGHIDATVRDFTISQIEDIINTARHSGEISINATCSPEVDTRTIENLNEGLRNMNINKKVKSITVTSEAVPFQLVDEKPTFQGGDANTFSRWVNLNLKYPEEAKEKGIQGRVTLSFTVSASGKVVDVKVLRSVDTLLDNEAVRVLEMSPEWVPGKHEGKPVAVKYTFPVIFMMKD